MSSIGIHFGFYLIILGFPISNDPLYGKGKRAKIEEPPKIKSEYFDDNCPECLNPHSDPTDEQLCLYLHAFRYKSEQWEFKTEYPIWAKEVT